MKKTKVFALFIVLVMMFSLAACGGGSQTSQTTSPQTTSPQNTGSPGTATTTTGTPPANTETSPTSAPAPSTGTTLSILYDRTEPTGLMIQAASNGATNLGTALFATLTTYNAETRQADQGLATSWEWVDDTHCRFHLRDDVTAYDGTTKLTADDVVFTIEYGAQGTQNNYQTIFDPSQCKAEDEHTVVIGLKKVYGDLPLMLTMSVYGIMSKSLAENICGGSDDYSALLRNPNCGFGMYTLKEWVEGDHILLQRNEHYYDAANMPFYQFIRVEWNTDFSARFLALQSGQYDVVYNLNFTQKQMLDSSSDLTYSAVGYNSTFALYLNTQYGALADQNVRNAISYAIDKATIAKTVTGGLVGPVDTFISSNSLWYYGDQTVPFDSGKAKELLAGYTPEQLTFNILGISEYEPELTMIKAMLADVGITINIQFMEFSAINSNLKNGDYQIYMTEIFGFDVGRLLLRIDGRETLASASGGCQYNDDYLNSLIDIVNSSTDFNARYNAMVEIQKILMDTSIVIGLRDVMLSAGHRSDITGMTNDAQGNAVFQTWRPVMS